MLKKVFITILAFCMMSFVFAAETAPPLSADKAFIFSAHLKQKNQLLLEWTIAPGYYLYRNQIKLTPPNQIELPPGEWRHDTLHGRYQAYEGSLKIPVTLAEKEKLNFTINYQGCSSAGFCYAPIKKNIKVDLSRVAVSQYSAESRNATEDHILTFFDGRHLFVIMFSFLGLGLLLAFTPCVLPMVPILSAIIIGHSKKTQKKKAFFLSLAYVAGTAVMYAIAGMVIALIGSNIQAQLQKPWVIILFSGLFIWLAFSMFGFYELQLPKHFRRQITTLSNKQHHGTYVGVFLMGCLSTLIISPCVSAPLVGVLAYIGQTGDALLGALALLSLGIGMGIPLLLIGISADKLLPKAGPWMKTLEKIFGVMMLGLAIWMLSRIILGPMISHSTPLFKVVHSMNEFDQQLANAKKNHQLALLDFYADWCDSCVIMDHTVFSNAAVRSALNDIVMLRADITMDNAFDESLFKRFHIIGPPTIIFFNRQGKELKSSRIVGEVSVKEFLENMQGVN